MIVKNNNHCRGMSPLIHGSPPPRNSLEDNSLAVPDAGEVTDAVQTAAVSIPSTSHVQYSDQTNNNENSSLCLLVATYLAAAQSEQLPCM